MVGVKEKLPGVVYLPTERLATYVTAGALPTTTLVEELAASFRTHAARPAICAADGIISYAELNERTDRLAKGLLDLGLAPLDRVLFQSANSPELVIALIGCLKAGLIPVCTLSAHRKVEIGYIGQSVDARAHIVQGDDAKFDLEDFALSMKDEIPTVKHVISLRGAPRAGVVRMEDLIAATDAAAARAAAENVPRDPFQVAIFQLSGGTTGVPKVIPRMQNDYLLNAQLTAQTLGYRADDVMFMPMPIIHNACMICFLMPTLLVGGAFIIAAGMSPKDWADAWRRNPPTIIGVIRALFPRLDETLALVPEGLDPVRFFWCADGARALREKYGKPAYGMFGMSEGMNMYCREGDPGEALDWTVGRPLSEFDDVHLVRPGTMEQAAPGEIGELIVRGPYTLAGYYNAPDRNRTAFTEDGYYRPGDLMVIREIGSSRYFAFAGRTKDVVDRGAEKINCEEVEAAVTTHPAVAACAVIGMPDPVLGERVCAYIVPRPGDEAPDVATMQAHLQSVGIAKFKWPERILLIDSIPVTKVGKFDKGKLREDIAKRLEQETEKA